MKILLAQGRIGLLAVALLACAQVGSAASVALGLRTFMVKSRDPGIELYVRNKHSTGMQTFPAERIVLFVHGATFPASSTFDADLPGGSWMQEIAQRGYDVYLLDIRGYGRSTRPVAMSQPPEANPPFAGTREAVRDISAACRKAGGRFSRETLLHGRAA